MSCTILHFLVLGNTKIQPFMVEKCDEYVPNQRGYTWDTPASACSSRFLQCTRSTNFCKDNKEVPFLAISRSTSTFFFDCRTQVHGNQERSTSQVGESSPGRWIPGQPTETNRERYRFYREDIDPNPMEHRFDEPGRVRHSQRRAGLLRAALPTWKTRRWIGRDRSWPRSCTDGSSLSPRCSDSSSDTGKKTSRS